jgi:nucleoside-diphosphate-sugar epimerase
VHDPDQPSRRAALGMVARGVRASVVRLPPSVHNQNKQGLVRFMIDIARKKRISAYVGDGHNRWPAVHRLDAARVFRLALERGSAGARYHAVAEEGIPLRDSAEVIGRRLNVPVVSKSARHFGFIGPFVSIDSPASSKLTQGRLGWRPTQPRLFSDLERITYSEPEQPAYLRRLCTAGTVVSPTFPCRSRIPWS